MPIRLLEPRPGPPSEEEARLAALNAFGVMDTPPSAPFDGLARLASIACATPIALVSLVDAERQWFKAACGLDVRETPREHAFCAYTIASDAVLEVEDARLDPRFADNPLVTGAPHIRFYAGAPLRTAGGHRLGSLCVIDTRPRRLDPAQRRMLEGLAAQVVVQLEQLQARREALAHGAVLEQTLESIPDGVVTCDANGILAEFNSTARDWHGVDPRALPPEQWADHFDLFDPAGERPLATETIPLVRAFRGEHVQRQQIVIRARGQAARTVLCNARQVVTSEGIVAGAVCVMYDVTAQQEADRALAAERARLASVIDASRDVAIIATDGEGIITLFNPGAEQLLGYTAEEVIGRESPLLFHLGAEVEARAGELSALTGHRVEGFDVFVRASRDGRVETRQWTYVRKDGALRQVRLSVSALHDADGGTSGFLGMAVDITEQVHAEDAARFAAERFTGAFNSAAQGMAIVCLDGRMAEVNDALCAMLGHDRAALQAMTFPQLTHPEDLRNGMAERASVLAGKGATLHARKRFLHCDGHSVWVQLSLSLVRDAQGAPVHFVAQVQDVSRQRTAEIERDAAAQRLLAITDNAPALIAYVDAEERFRFVNTAFCEWYGVAAEDVLGRTIEAFRGAEARGRVASVLERAFGGERVSVETDVAHVDQGLRSCQVTFIPDRAEDGTVRGVHVMIFDVSAQRALTRLMEERALTDELTGLPNRAAWAAELDRTIASAKRSGESVAVLFIDLDHFKQVNDEHGHAAGDCVLASFARCLESAVRAGDFVARLAGDEFVVLLHGKEDLRDSAERLGQRIREGARAGASFEERLLPISPSIGIAVQSAGAIEATSLMAAADEAMYRAKQLLRR